MAKRLTTHQNMQIYRPGMLRNGAYSPVTDNKQGAKPMRKFLLFLIIIAAIIGVGYKVDHSYNKATYKSGSPASINVPAQTTISKNECSGNTADKDIVVSLKRQHIWACQYTLAVFNSPVVTGYTGNPADVTPTGTFHIFTKETNVSLKGTDGVTTWDDPVSYWMPFLFNQYGAYGFHDATWRTPNQFGHINTASPNASHGCVECPLPTAKWLYSWAPIGTEVTIRV